MIVYVDIDGTIADTPRLGKSYDYKSSIPRYKQIDKINKLYQNTVLAISYLDSSYTELINKSNYYTNIDERNLYLTVDKYNKKKIHLQLKFFLYHKMIIYVHNNHKIIFQLKLLDTY